MYNSFYICHISIITINTGSEQARQMSWGGLRALARALGESLPAIWRGCEATTKERNSPPSRARIAPAEGGGLPAEVESSAGSMGRTCSARPRPEAEEDKRRGLRRALALRKVERESQRGADNAMRARGSPSLITRLRQWRSTRREAPLALAEIEACGGSARIPFWVGVRGQARLRSQKGARLTLQLFGRESGAR